MAEKKQIPLDELLFGGRAAPSDKPEPTLAEAITICYHEGLDRARRYQAAQKSSLPRPPGEPKR